MEKTCSSVILSAVLLIISGTQDCRCNSHYYSSLKDMRMLFDVEDDLINALETFVENEIKNINQLQRIMDDLDMRLYNQSNYKPSLNIDLTNLLPIDEPIKLNIRAPKAIPDLEGASRAISRIQSVHEIRFEDMKNGRLCGNMPSLTLSAKDIFQIGKQAFLDNNFETCTTWLMELVLNMTDMTSLEIDELYAALDYLHLSLYQMGNTKEALKIAQILLNQDLEDEEEESERLQKYIKLYERVLNGIMEAPQPKTEDKSLLPPRLCQDRYEKTAEDEKDLFCWYSSKNDAFYLIQPFKVEHAHHEPDIWLYRNFLSDTEADWFIEYGKENQLSLSEVRQKDTYKPATVIRTSKTCWIDYDKKFTSALDLRIRSIMGPVGKRLRLEQLQVANYGIGGHYNRHVDTRDPNFYQHEDNRYSTLLVYLENVEKGGSTVFTDIGIGIKPQKGTAVVWKNYNELLIVDQRTNHCSCPVVYGEKWGLNVWMRHGTSLFQSPAR